MKKHDCKEYLAVDKVAIFEGSYDKKSDSFLIDSKNFDGDRVVVCSLCDKKFPDIKLEWDED